MKKYAADIGNGTATEFTVTHNLGTQDVTVLLREKASPFNQVFCDVQIVSTTQIKLLFATAPAAGRYLGGCDRIGGSYSYETVWKRI